jgi:hypothetical protein
VLLVLTRQNFIDAAPPQASRRRIAPTVPTPAPSAAPAAAAPLAPATPTQPPAPASLLSSAPPLTLPALTQPAAAAAAPEDNGPRQKGASFAGEDIPAVPDALLPDGWTAHVDPASGKTFYVAASGDTAWDVPAALPAAASDI